MINVVYLDLVYLIYKGIKATFGYFQDTSYFSLIATILPFIKYPLIYISVTEAGSATFKLDLNSMPIDTTNTTLKKGRCDQSRRLNYAMKMIVNKPQPFRYGDGPEYDTWRYVSFYMNEFVPKIIASNVWLFSRLIAWGLIDPKQVNTRNYKI